MITYKPLPIIDPDVQTVMHNTKTSWILDFKDEFIETYDRWIRSSKNFVINGLDTFKKVSVTDGVTGAFSNFEKMYSGETVVFRGEYPFHRDTGATVIDFVNQLSKGQKLIISLPFSATGSTHPLMKQALDICRALDIPVFVDMAYFGISNLPPVDVSHPAIKMVAFSHSKTFATGKCKIGLCYHNTDGVSPMELLNQYNYINHISAGTHIQLMKIFTPDHMYCKYHVKQKLIAEVLEVDASPCVHLCTSTDDKWKGFSRDGFINRLGVAPLLVSYPFDKDSILRATRVPKP